MTEISTRYRDLATEFTRRVDAVPGDRWASPSPCAGWTARDVVRHVIDTHAAMPGYAGMSLTLTQSVDDDAPGAWAEARDAMQELLEDPGRARPYPVRPELPPASPSGGRCPPNEGQPAANAGRRASQVQNLSRYRVASKAFS